MSYGFHQSIECQPHGSGQCDGYDYDMNVACNCSCHDSWDLFRTTEEVKQWHDELHGISNWITLTATDENGVVLDYVKVTREDFLAAQNTNKSPVEAFAILSELQIGA